MIDAIAAALAPHGLILRGGFDFGPDETAPAGPSGAPAKAVLLIGQAGSAAWFHFSQWREQQPGDFPNPLDTWSREVIGAAAEKCGARPVSPSDRPFLPFQQWAMRAEGLKPSPLGILMHPEYGLWHAYRGALLFDRTLTLPAPRGWFHLCDRCDEKPCLNSCPINAYSDAGFAHQACLAYAGGQSGAVCGTTGCFARNACPMGHRYRYLADQQTFHMASFLAG